MISNLKLWENITLPLHFTTGNIPPETEDYVADCSRKLGITFNLNELPACLSPHERRVAAFIRASLCQPRIMVYNYCFENIAAAARKSFYAATSEFHSAAPGRTSLYFVSSADMARNLPADAIIKVHDTVDPAMGSA
jgi:phospholipid/cholesterol/gamma-HCH transport system ATP-binding protein